MLRAPPSVKKMGGSETRQEGNYASSDLASLGRLPLQNDLGLTLLPGSQIEENGEEPADEAAAFEYGYLSTLRECDAATAATQVIQGNRQSLALIHGDGDVVAGEPDAQIDSLQKLPRQQETSSQVANGRLRYSLRVRPSTKVIQEPARPKRRHLETSPSRCPASEHIISEALPPSDQRSMQNEVQTSIESLPGKDRQTLCTYSQTTVSRSSRQSPLLLSTTIAQRRAQSSTSVYPQGPKRRVLSTKAHSPDKSSPPQPPRPINGQSPVEESTSAASARALSTLRTELKQTRKNLFQKTRAESEAQHTIYELRKTHCELSATTKAHVDLQNVHNKLLDDHRRLLESYNSLAKAHTGCRSTSSRKLAQRIIDAAPASQRAVHPYPSPSPSVTAYPTWSGSYANSNAAAPFSQPASPLIDLTRSPSPAPASLLQPTGTISAPCLDHGRQIEAEGESDSANINGFDEEATELFNAIWANEMGGYDAGNRGAMES